MELIVDRVVLDSKAQPKTTVSKGKFTPTGEEVCIKESYFDSLEEANAAVREALHQLSIHHPAVVSIKTQYLEQAEEEWKVVIVMELMLSDLQRELSKRKRRKVAWGEAELLDILKPLAGALALAQQRNIAHRDICLNNLFLSPTGQVKIGDFGMSKWDGGRLDLHTCTGTLPYLSPLLRQAMAATLARSISSRQAKVAHNAYKSDVYALGVCLLALAKGKEPMDMQGEGEPAEVMLQEVRSLQGYEALKPHLEAMLSPEEGNRPDFTELAQLLATSADSVDSSPTINPFDLLQTPTISITADGSGGFHGQQRGSIGVSPDPTEALCELCYHVLEEDGGTLRCSQVGCAFNSIQCISDVPMQETCQQCSRPWGLSPLCLPCGHSYCSLPCLLTYISARTSYFRLRPALMCQLCKVPFSYRLVYKWVGGSQAYFRLSLQIQRKCVFCDSRNSQYRLRCAKHFVCFECLPNERSLNCPFCK